MLAAAVLTLAGCSAQESRDTSKTAPDQIAQQDDDSREDTYGPPPTFKAEWVPPAKGSGNFEVCLRKTAAEDGLTTVTIPDNVVLQSWGQLVTDLREPLNGDPRVIASIHAPDLTDATSYAVITTEPVTLTTAQPCRITTVRAATNDGFRWTHEIVPADLHYVFAPHPTQIRGRVVTADYWGATDPTKPHAPRTDGVAGDAIAAEEFTGVLLKDAANAISLADLD